MARNVQLSVLRGSASSMPALADGEFYFATDILQLYVGLNGDILPIGGTMAVQVQGSGGNFNILQPQGDGSLPVSLGNYTKTSILKTGQLTTTAVTANQVVLTYTVTAGKTLYLQHADLQARLTTLSGTASILGTFIIQIAGVTVYTATFVNPTTSDAGSQVRAVDVAEPIPLPAGTVIQFLTTPAAATSMLWTANFMGYEK